MGSGLVHSSVKVGDGKKKPRSASVDFFFGGHSGWISSSRLVKKKHGARCNREWARKQSQYPTGIALIACDCDACSQIAGVPILRTIFLFPVSPLPKGVARRMARRQFYARVDPKTTLWRENAAADTFLCSALGFRFQHVGGVLPDFLASWTDGFSSLVSSYARFSQCCAREFCCKTTRRSRSTRIFAA